MRVYLLPNFSDCHDWTMYCMYCVLWKRWNNTSDIIIIQLCRKEATNRWHTNTYDLMFLPKSAKWICVYVTDNFLLHTHWKQYNKLLKTDRQAGRVERVQITYTHIIILHKLHIAQMCLHMTSLHTNTCAYLSTFCVNLPMLIV